MIEIPGKSNFHSSFEIEHGIVVSTFSNFNIVGDDAKVEFALINMDGPQAYIKFEDELIKDSKELTITLEAKYKPGETPVSASYKAVFMSGVEPPQGGYNDQKRELPNLKIDNALELRNVFKITGTAVRIEPVNALDPADAYFIPRRLKDNKLYSALDLKDDYYQYFETNGIWSIGFTGKARDGIIVKEDGKTIS